MSQGPSLQGQIVINTQSVDKAITSVKKLQTNVQKSFGLGGQAAEKFSKTLEQQTQSYNKVAQSNQKYQNIIAKAANQVANYEAAVRKSNVADGKKADLVKRASAELKGFEQAVRAGAASGKSLENVTTQLNVSMGQLKRDLSSTSKATRDKAKATKDLEAAQIRTDKAVSQSSIQYQKAAQAVRDSGLAEADKLVTLRKLDAEHKKLTSTLTNANTTTRKAAAAQNRFRESLSQVNQVTRQSRMTQQAAATNKYATEMRNLSTSVVVALGPLSGVAARLTALTTLFNRNAASIATVLAAMTGLSVLFSRSAQAAQEAEKQMFRINAQLEILGETSQIAGDELNEMAHQIARATLLSAKEVRDASGALIEFGGIGRSQFAEVTKVAQGMSAVFGGNLRGNIRKLGRAIEEPVDGLQRLERSGIILDEQTTELIESLSAQGRTFEATNVLLKETVSLQKAAEAEAKGLAGAYDTVSGNLDRMYENLFIASGASEALAGSVNDVANAIEEFSNSADAAALGEVFVDIADYAGTAFKFLINNIDVLALGLAFIAGSVVPKAIIAFATMSGTALTNLIKSLVAAKAAVVGFATGTRSATAATAGFNTVLKANPLLAVASGVTTLVAALWSYNSAMDAVTSAGEGMNSTLIGQIKDQITVRNDLTKTQVDGFRKELNLLEQTMNSQSEKYDEAEKREKALTAALIERYETEQGLFTDLGEAVAYRDQITSLEGLIELSKTLEGEQKEQVEQLILAKRSSDAYKTSMEQTEKAAKELAKTVDEATPGKEANLNLKSQLQTVKDLTKEYLKEVAEVEELETALQRASDVQKGLLVSRDKANSISEWNEINQAIQRTDKIMEEIRKEMREVNETEMDKSSQKLIDTLLEVTRVADVAFKSIGASDAEIAVIELNKEMEDLKDTTKDLFSDISASALSGFKDSLPGVNQSSSLEDVVEAYLAYVRAQKEATLASERQASAHDTLKQFREDERSQLASLVAQYGELQRASRMSNGGTPDESLADWLKEEQAKVDAQASQIVSTPFTDLDNLEAEFETRRQALQDMYGRESADYQKHLDTMKEQAERNRTFMAFADGSEKAADIVGQSMQLMETAGKENSSAYKAMAIMQATIASSLAIAKVWADNPNPAYAIPMTALVSANLGAQIASIKSQNYANGGYVSGPGTSKSDSVAANLSNGEFVMQAEAVKEIGRKNLEMANAGRMSSFSGGGSVGPSPMPSGSLSGSGTNSGGINFTVIDNSSGDKSYRTEEGVDQNGNREMKLIIDNVVKQGITSGQYDRQMGGRYGVKHKGRKV